MRDNLRKVLVVTLLLMLAPGAVSAFFRRHRAGDIQRFAGDRLNSIFHPTLPASGRAQTLRGTQT